MNREGAQTTPGYSAHGKRSCSWARITHSAPVTLQFFKRDLIPPSICWQPAGDPHKPGLVLFEARPSSGVGVMGPLCSPRPLREAPSLAPPAPFPASDEHSRDTASLADAGNTHQGLPDFHPHCGAATHWATSSSKAFMPFQDCFFVPDKLIFKMFMNIYKMQVKDANTTSLQWPSSTREAPLPCRDLTQPFDTSLSLEVHPCGSAVVEWHCAASPDTVPRIPDSGSTFPSIFHCEGLDLGAHLLQPSCHREEGSEPPHSLPGDSMCPLLGLTTALGLLKLSWKSLWVEKDRAKMVTGSKILLLAQSWPPNWYINFGNCLTLKIPG